MPGQFLNSAVGAVLLLLLAGLANTCLHGSQPIPVPTEEVPEETKAAPNVELIKEPLPPAVHSLLRKSQAALEHKDMEEAEAHAERAYRMEGRDYRVLFMRARVSLANGNAEDAEQWAQRALGSLPAKYREHRRQTWEFIARARALRGDVVGHDAALQEAHSIR
jgi:predicted Zn-dependent protease